MGPQGLELVGIKPFLVFVGIATIIVDIPPFLRRVTLFLTPENTPGLDIIGVSFGVSSMCRRHISDGK